MCGVTAIIGAVSAASSVVGYIGQAQQAQQQQAYQNQVYQQQLEQQRQQHEYQSQLVTNQNEYILQNAENARIALQADRRSLVSRERQEGLATALDLEQKRIERLKAVGALQSSERAGLSLQTLMSDYYRQEATYQSVANQNLSFTSQQIAREQNKLTANATSRINEARPYIPAPIQSPYAPAPVQGPSLLGTALEIGGSALGTFGANRTYSPYDYSTSSAYQSPTTPSRFRIDYKELYS